MKVNKFLVGLGIGAVAGMLLAPKKGSELRSDIAAKAKEVSNLTKDDVVNTFNSTLNTIQTAITEFDSEKFKQSTQDKLVKLSAQVEDLKNKVIDSEQFNSLIGTFNHIANAVNDKVVEIIDEMEDEIEDIQEDIEEEIDETAKEIEDLISEMKSDQ